MPSAASTVGLDEEELGALLKAEWFGLLSQPKPDINLDRYINMLGDVRAGLQA